LRPPVKVVSQWFRVARRPVIVRRAIAFAIVVGAVLIGINHGDAILRGDVSTLRLCKMALTVVVPYAVSTLSSVAAVVEQERETAPST
jgi:hypothetical protein